MALSLSSPSRVWRESWLNCRPGEKIIIKSACLRELSSWVGKPVIHCKQTDNFIFLIMKLRNHAPNYQTSISRKKVWISSPLIRRVANSQYQRYGESPRGNSPHQRCGKLLISVSLIRRVGDSPYRGYRESPAEFCSENSPSQWYADLQKVIFSWFKELPNPWMAQFGKN